MPSCLAAAFALPSSRDAMPATVTPLACSMAGMTFFMPISAVLTMPQTTGFMRFPFLRCCRILGALECAAKIGDNVFRSVPGTARAADFLSRRLAGHGGLAPVLEAADRGDARHGNGPVRDRKAA